MLERMTIFVSHKSADYDIAAKVQDALKNLVEPEHTGIFDCFLSEKISHGQDWLDELHEKLHMASCLILIFTDPSEDWSWCMYESGYYSALLYLQQKDQLKANAYARRRRVFCLHHPDLPPPSPLAHLQATKATPDRVLQLVEGILGDAGIAVEGAADCAVRTISRGKVDKAVETIANCFNLRDAVRLRTHNLTLNVENVIATSDARNKENIDPRSGLEKALPSGSYFTGTDEALRAIFQRSPSRNRLSWSEAVRTSHNMEFEDGRQQFDQRWLAELVDIMYDAANSYYPQRPIRGLVFTGANDIIYSPVIRKISEHRNGRLTCDIVFLKWEGNQYPKAPEHIRQLLIAVRMATRLRQEILDEFNDFGEVARLESRQGRRNNFCRKVWRAYYEVMTEGISRGLSTIILGKAFNVAGRKLLRDMTEEFNIASATLAELVGGKADLSTSLIEESLPQTQFSDEQIKKFDDVYEILSMINFKFLIMANIALEKYFASARTWAEWERIKSELSGITEINGTTECHPFDGTLNIHQIVESLKGGWKPPEDSPGVN